MITLNLFTTITNANFDKESIEARIRATLTEKDVLLAQIADPSGLPEAAKWNGSGNWEEKAATVGVLSTENEDIRSLRELIQLSSLQKLAQIIKEYNSNHCLDYAQVQEAIGNICLITANISQAKQHFQKALRIYEDIWADEPELIEEKHKKIQELYPQAGIALAKSILHTKH